MDDLNNNQFHEILLPRRRIHPSFSHSSRKPRGFPDETLGVIAQLVERLHGMEEVWGSTPHGSTKCLLASPADRVEKLGELAAQ